MTPNQALAILEAVKYLILFVFLFSPSLFAANKSACSSRERELKNCYLHFKNYKVQINSEKILLTDGVWRAIYDLPVFGKGTQWQSLGFKTLGKRLLFELKIWSEVEQQLGIQSLYWYVYEVKNETLEMKIDRVIQKRRPREGEKPLIDPMEKHGLKWIKKGQIKWWVGVEKGLF